MGWRTGICGPVIIAVGVSVCTRLCMTCVGDFVASLSDYVSVDYVSVDYVSVDYVSVDYVSVDDVSVDDVSVDYVSVD
eukprot:1587587-Rhodomonas_salina.1